MKYSEYEANLACKPAQLDFQSSYKTASILLYSMYLAVGISKPNGRLGVLCSETCEIPVDSAVCFRSIDRQVLVRLTFRDLYNLFVGVCIYYDTIGDYDDLINHKRKKDTIQLTSKRYSLDLKRRTNKKRRPSY